MNKRILSKVSARYKVRHKSSHGDNDHGAQPAERVETLKDAELAEFSDAKGSLIMKKMVRDTSESDDASLTPKSIDVKPTLVTHTSSSRDHSRKSNAQLLGSNVLVRL